MRHQSHLLAAARLGAALGTALSVTTAAAFKGPRQWVPYSTFENYL
jgi:hypothetical protein